MPFTRFTLFCCCLLVFFVPAFLAEDHTFVLRVHYPEDQPLFSFCPKCSFVATVSPLFLLSDPFAGQSGNLTEMLKVGPNLWQTNVTIGVPENVIEVGVYLLLNSPLQLQVGSQVGPLCRAFSSLNTVQNLGSRQLFRLDDLKTRNNQLELFPSFCEMSARVDERVAFSSTLQREVKVLTYVPPSLRENDLLRTVNVLFLLDGQLLPLLQSQLDSLLLTGELAETIVVGIASNTSNPAERLNDLTPTQCNTNRPHTGKGNLCRSFCELLPPDAPTGGGPLLIDYLRYELLPYTIKRYSLGPLTPAQVGLAGFSLGGLMSCSALVHQDDLFGRAYCGSPSLWWNCEELFDQLVAKLESLPREQVMDGARLFLSTGGGEPSIYGPTAHLVELLVRNTSLALGRDLQVHHLSAGQHSLSSWVKSFSTAVSFLFPPSVYSL